MKEVPDIISCKDLDYISDMFNWNFNASKVARHFSLEAEDSDVIEILEDITTMHSNICERLVEILERKTEDE